MDEGSANAGIAEEEGEARLMGEEVAHRSTKKKAERRKKTRKNRRGGQAARTWAFMGTKLAPFHPWKTK
uniref:Uncharacterized protein n=1 Tax=Oryza sativa subsp. japonica TaxID=39947 RepID=Q69TY3_ORYSJ|nr:hypothetical protein [Oryza sativa Japonica Group]BAD37739.1 hypothetical protein [Oryza sativa Japonica Group]